MCDELSTEWQTSPQLTSSSTPLPSSLIDMNGINGNDLSQFNYLINLIEIPINVFNDGINREINDEINHQMEAKRIKHRLTERVRHKKIIELINRLSDCIGLNDKHETQSNVLTRASRYALFLSYVTEKLEQQSDSNVQISWDDWLSQMHQFYQKAYDNVSLMTQTNTEGKTHAKSSALEKRVQQNSDEVQQTLPKEYSGDYARETLHKTPDHCLPLKKRAKMIMFSDFQD